MNVNVFCDYVIKYSLDATVQTSFDEFEQQKSSEIVKLNGGELIEWISKLLNDSELIAVDIKGNRLFFECYRPTGEGSDLEILIEKEILENAGID